MIKLLLLAALAFVAWRLFAPTIRGTADVSRARKLLGVGPMATRDDILAAHRRLVTKVHPDAGGSEGLAAEINAARDTLLRSVASR